MIELFSIPIWRSTFLDYDQNRTIEIIEDHIDTFGEAHLSNQYGLQSKKDLHRSTELSPILNFVLDSARTALLDLHFSNKNTRIVESWGNINNSLNAYNTTHVHQGILSGVFYVSAPEGSGDLLIHNPGINCLWYGFLKAQDRNKFTSEVAEFKPQNGELILWPSFLPHSVKTNRLDVKRVSIAFNIIAD